MGFGALAFSFASFLFFNKINLREEELGLFWFFEFTKDKLKFLQVGKSQPLRPWANLTSLPRARNSLWEELKRRWFFGKRLFWLFRRGFLVFEFLVVWARPEFDAVGVFVRVTCVAVFSVVVVGVARILNWHASQWNQEPINRGYKRQWLKLGSLCIKPESGIW